MSKSTFEQAKSRYRRLFFPAMVVYTAACIGGALVLAPMENPPLWLPVLIAILTIAPILIAFWLIWRYVQETDEYERMRQLESLAIAGIVTASAAGAIGFLQLYEALPNFPVFLLLPFFFLTYGIAKWVRQGSCA